MEGLMDLTQDSWLVKWAYSNPSTWISLVFTRKWRGDDIPCQTNLCVFFWRCVLLAPFGCFLAAFALVVSAPFVAIYWLVIQPVAWVVRVCGGRQSIQSVWFRIVDAVEDRFDGTAEARVITAMLRAKRKVCPIIHIESTDI
jgi:hypothetical protein